MTRPAATPRPGGDGKRRADLAKIHIAKKDLEMDDTHYRALLRRETGKQSSADLTAAERARALAAFERIGWRPKPRAAAPAGSAPHGAPAQRRKIAALLRGAGLPPAYGQGIAKRMFGKRLEFCSPDQLRAVTAALVKSGQRQAARRRRRRDRQK